MVSFGCWYWYEKAAKQGHAAAQFNLGECYENGYGVPQDVSKAKYWMEKAAKQGFVKAKEALEQLKWYIDRNDKMGQILRPNINNCWAIDQIIENETEDTISFNAIGTTGQCRSPDSVGNNLL